VEGFQIPRHVRGVLGGGLFGLQIDCSGSRSGVNRCQRRQASRTGGQSFKCRWAQLTPNRFQAWLGGGGIPRFKRFEVLSLGKHRRPGGALQQLSSPRSITRNRQAIRPLAIQEIKYGFWPSGPYDRCSFSPCCGGLRWEAEGAIARVAMARGSRYGRWGVSSKQ